MSGYMSFGINCIQYREVYDMPVFRSGKGLAPKWCEMDFFEIIELPIGTTHEFGRMGEKEKLIVGKGKCQINLGDQNIMAEKGANLDLTSQDERFRVKEVMEPVTLIRMCGRWGDEIGGSGIFTANQNDNPNNPGDPVDYPRNTNFDNHFHDCDEYWILFEGRGIAVSEGKHYEVSAGDCVVTGMGYHHDFPNVFEPVTAVYFETTLEGEKRHGHLWSYQQGKAEPKMDRI